MEEIIQRTSDTPHQPALSTLKESPRSETFLPHLSDSIRADLVHHTHLPGLTKRILIFSQIFFGQGINMRVGTLFGDFYHLALYRQMALRIIRIKDGECHVLVV